MTFSIVGSQLGYGPSRIFLRSMPNPYHFVHPDDREQVERATTAYLSGETKEYETEYRLRHKDGSYRWTLARGVAERDDAGKPRRLTGSIVDITDIKRAEAASARGQGDRRKRRTAPRTSSSPMSATRSARPMNAILGMTELVLDTPLNG